MAHPEYCLVTEQTKLSRLLLISLVAALAGCGSSDSQVPAATATPSSSKPVQAATASPAPAATAEKEVVSRERVLRAMTCQIVLGQAVGTKMANADTGLPPDLVERLKASSITRWDTFAVEHAQSAGVQDEDRMALIVSLSKLSSSAEDRQQTIDTVRDCLDGEP